MLAPERCFHCFCSRFRIEETKLSIVRHLRRYITTVFSVRTPQRLLRRYKLNSLSEARVRGI